MTQILPHILRFIKCLPSFKINNLVKGKEKIDSYFYLSVIKIRTCGYKLSTISYSLLRVVTKVVVESGSIIPVK